MDLVTGVHSTLLSAVKFAYVDYIKILDKEGIKIYDGKTTKKSSHKRQCSVGTAQNKDYGTLF